MRIRGRREKSFLERRRKWSVESESLHIFRLWIPNEVLRVRIEFRVLYMRPQLFEVRLANVRDSRAEKQVRLEVPRALWSKTGRGKVAGADKKQAPFIIRETKHLCVQITQLVVLNAAHRTNG